MGCKSKGMGNFKRDFHHFFQHKHKRHTETQKKEKKTPNHNKSIYCAFVCRLKGKSDTKSSKEKRLHFIDSKMRSHAM